jgi:hypothetical protein
MWYMPMHLAAHKLGGSLYRFSLFGSICLFYKTSLLASNCFQIGGGVDDIILWLSFAQQKWREITQDKIMQHFPQTYDRLSLVAAYIMGTN